MKHDIRCKGTKTDQNLLDEYFKYEYCTCPAYWTRMWHCECYEERKRLRQAIEKELGIQAIEKEKENRRLNAIEHRLTKLEKRKRFLFF